MGEEHQSSRPSRNSANTSNSVLRESVKSSLSSGMSMSVESVVANEFCVCFRLAQFPGRHRTVSFTSTGSKVLFQFLRIILKSTACWTPQGARF